MTQKKIIRLTALLAWVMLTVIALVLYGGGFAQDTHGQQQEAAKDSAPEPVDSVALAQGWQVLQKITDRYRNISLMVTGEIRYYATDSANAVATEKNSFAFGMEKDKSFYELDSVITVTTNDVAVIVDKKEESIAVIEKSSLEAEPGQVQPMPDMFTEMKEFVKNIIISQAGAYKQLTISFTEDAPSNMLEYVIVYDAQTYSIKKLRMKMADGEITDAAPSAGDDSEAVSNKVSEDDELFFVDSANNAIPTGIYAAVSVNVYEIIYNQERAMDKNIINTENYVKKAGDAYVPAAKFKKFSILN